MCNVKESYIWSVRLFYASLLNWIFNIYSSDNEDTTLWTAERDEDSHVNGGYSVTKRGPNGHRPIDLTPPDMLLQRTEKRVAKNISNKEVR